MTEKYRGRLEGCRGHLKRPLKVVGLCSQLRSKLTEWILKPLNTQTTAWGLTRTAHQRLGWRLLLETLMFQGHLYSHVTYASDSSFKTEQHREMG